MKLSELLYILQKSFYSLGEFLGKKEQYKIHATGKEISLVYQKGPKRLKGQCHGIFDPI